MNAQTSSDETLRKMEEQLREALKSHEANLKLFPLSPKDDKTAQVASLTQEGNEFVLVKAKAEIEEIIEKLRELLSVSDASLCRDIKMDEESHGRKRKHIKEPSKSLEERQILAEFFDRPIHFQPLAEKHPNFKKHVWSTRDGSPTIDFADPKATLELTKVLLKEYYDIAWDIPLGQLVPPVPCRAKYINWIHDLLQLSSPNRSSVMGLDVGCGANCIYPLLGASTYGWKFIGTDITDVAVDYANRNKNRNAHISSLIEIFKVPENCSALLLPAVEKFGFFHFSMCNPPFFSEIAEAGHNQRTAFGGTPQEMVYPGGELAFVHKLVDESLQLRERIHWYTVMLGKKSTFKQIRSHLHVIGVDALRTGTLLQGKTTRWTIAWSFAAKGTNNEPLRPVSTSESLLCSVESFGKSSDELMTCLIEISDVYGGKLKHKTETKLIFEFKNESKKESVKVRDAVVEIYPESSHSFILIPSKQHPFPFGVFPKLCQDLNILWTYQKGTQ